MSETPQFGRLLQAGFKSVGITYITINHLRKANKNVTTEVFIHYSRHLMGLIEEIARIRRTMEAIV